MQASLEGEAATIAYEYAFGNPMDRVAAVNLKSIDTTGVNVSYIYSNERIDPELKHTATTKFECQTLAETGSEGSNKYFYILVSPTETTIPTTFIRSIVWWYGIPQQISISNNLGAPSSPMTVVTNQQITTDILPEMPIKTVEDYGECYFDAWFYDEEYTQPIQEKDILDIHTPIYARYHNFPLNSTEYVTFENEAYAIANCVTYGNYSAVYNLPNNLIIPTYYNDGQHGVYPVTAIASRAFSCMDDEGDYSYGASITSVDMPNTIITVGSRAFYWCETLINIKPSIALEDINGAFRNCGIISLDLSKCANLRDIGDAFAESYIRDIILPEGLTEIGSGAFLDCTSLTSIKIPTTVERMAFVSNYSRLESIDLTGCVNLTSISLRLNSLQSIDLSDCVNLTTITANAFAYCSGLTTVILPPNLTTIEEYAFTETNISSIVIPASVNHIGAYAFYASELTYMEFEDPSLWAQNFTDPYSNAENFRVMGGDYYDWDITR